MAFSLQDLLIGHMRRSMTNPLWEDRDTAAAPEPTAVTATGDAAELLRPLESAMHAMAEAQGVQLSSDYDDAGDAAAPVSQKDGDVPSGGSAASASSASAPDTDAATEAHATPADVPRRQHGGGEEPESPLCWTLAAEPTVVHNRCRCAPHRPYP